MSHSRVATAALALVAAAASASALAGEAAGPAVAPPHATEALHSPPLPPAEAERIYRERLQSFLSDYANFRYDPMVPLRGATTLTPLPRAKRSQRTISAKSLDAARNYAEAMDSDAFIVWRNGKVEAEWYGNGHDAKSELVSKSLSKPLIALAVGRAIALGHIRSVDQSIADFVPMVRGTDKEAITVRYLLDMRSGLLDQGFSTDPKHPLNTAYLGTDHGTSIVREYPMTRVPGRTYSYANATADLVALVIEGATGQRFEDFVGDALLAPIGASGGRIWLNRPGGLAHSGCCQMLPADTFLRLAILMQQDGTWNGERLLPRGYVNQMRAGTPANPNYGMGVWLGEPWQERRGFGAPGTAGPKVLHSEPFVDPDLYLFDGNSNQIVAISPRNNLIVLRMGPNPPKPDAEHPEWDNAYLANTLMRGIRK